MKRLQYINTDVGIFSNIYTAAIKGPTFKLLNFSICSVKNVLFSNIFLQSIFHMKELKGEVVMNNVDTITLKMSCRRFKKSEVRNRSQKPNWQYIFKMTTQIISRLKLYKEDKEIRERARLRLKTENLTEFIFKLSLENNKENYFWHGQSNGLTFAFNEKWQYLLIFVPHELVAPRTEDEIIAYVEKVIIDYFSFQKEELNPLTLFRIDVKNDYQYQDNEEWEIIKNIIDKAPDTIYSYKKDVRRNDDTGYVVKYVSSKGNPKKESGNNVL